MSLSNSNSQLNEQSHLANQSYSSSALMYLQQSAGALAGVRAITSDTIRQDLRTRIDTLQCECAAFEKTAALQRTRVSELEKLRELLRVLDQPEAMAPAGDAE